MPNAIAENPDSYRRVWISPQRREAQGANAIAKPNEENPMASMPIQDSMAKIP